MLCSIQNKQSTGFSASSRWIGHRSTSVPWPATQVPYFFSHYEKGWGEQLPLLRITQSTFSYETQATVTWAKRAFPTCTSSWYQHKLYHLQKPYLKPKFQKEGMKRHVMALDKYFSTQVTFLRNSPDLH